MKENFVGRGDHLAFPEYRMEMRKIASESARDRRISIANARSVESIKARLKLLEEKNATMREKCREIFGEKENLKSR